MTIENAAQSEADALRHRVVVPFRGNDLQRMRALAVHLPATIRQGRTFRPAEVMMLLPLIVPITVLILLALLGWFVCWLVTVTVMAVSIVTADVSRAVAGRFGCRTAAPPATGLLPH